MASARPYRPLALVSIREFSEGLPLLGLPRRQPRHRHPPFLKGASALPLPPPARHRRSASAQQSPNSAGLAAIRSPQPPLPAISRARRYDSHCKTMLLPLGKPTTTRLQRRSVLRRGRRPRLGVCNRGPPGLPGLRLGLDTICTPKRCCFTKSVAPSAPAAAAERSCALRSRQGLFHFTRSISLRLPPPAIRSAPYVPGKVYLTLLTRS